MKRLAAFLAIALALGFSSLPAKAFVQAENTDAYVVSSCGAQAFPLGVWATITQLANGNLCTVGASSSNAEFVQGTGAAGAPLGGVLSIQGVSGGTPLTVTPTPDVGAAALATGQQAITNTVGGTQIVAARTGAPGTGRVSVTVINPSTGGILYLGNSGLTTTTGVAVAPGSAFTMNFTGALFGIVATGTQTVTFFETF